VHLTANLQVDPAWRSLDPAMLDWAEVQCLAAQRDAAGNRATPAVVPVIEVFVYTYDEARRALLAARGYTETEQSGVVRRMHFGGRDWPPPTLPSGYTLRTTHPVGPETPSAHTRTANELRKIDALARHDAQAIADLLNAAFGRDFHNAAEYLTFAQHAPSFRRDLDLVAAAPDGALAAYVGVPYDSANRHGIFEPVCTHPEHRRLGLAQALMVEGLRRLRALGAVDVTVETGDAQAANRLYDSLGFDEIERGTLWRKELSP
jgi:mycothiol synthase